MDNNFADVQIINLSTYASRYSRSFKNSSIEFPKNEYNTTNTVLFNDEEDIDFELEKYLYEKLPENSVDFIIEGDLMPNYYKEDKVVYGDEIFIFLKSFIYEVFKVEDIYVAKNDFFDLVGYGDTEKEARLDLYSCLSDTWSEYAMESDDKLDYNARLLKQKLLKNIRKL